ncbi:major facilitator superfamily domain-containing protein, partial [Dimargaris cristalligena]
YTVFSTRQKKFIVLLLSTAGLVAPLSSTMYLPALNTIQTEMNTTSVMLKLTISLYMVGMGIAPMVWGTLSDTVGRRPIYIISFVIYILACVGCALSNGIGMLLAMRLIQSLGSSSVIAVGAGSLCDLFEAKRRGRALGFFFVGALIGPIIGPTIGGYVSQYLDWRWTFWILAILGGVVLVLIVIFLPETHRGVVAAKYDVRMENVTPPSKSWAFNPLLPLYYLKYPYVTLTIINISLAYGGLYAMSTSMPASFARVYNLSTSNVGLTYIASGVGNIIGSVAGGNFADFMMHRFRDRMERAQVAAEPHEDGDAPTITIADVPKEQRLTGGVYFCWLMPTCLLIFGWLINKHEPLAAVLVVQFFFGLGMTFIFSAYSTYLVDIFTGRSATITALNNSTRSIWAAVCSVIEDPIETGIGPGWTFTLFALL